MTPKELVDLVRRASPEIAPDIGDEQARLLLRAVCAELLAQLDAVGEGRLEVPVLGCFEVMPSNAMAQPATATRVMFVPAEESD